MAEDNDHCFQFVSWKLLDKSDVFIQTGFDKDKKRIYIELDQGQFSRLTYENKYLLSNRKTGQFRRISPADKEDLI